MRFMMLVRADDNTEAGQMPPKEAIEAMEKYNDELNKAGVLLALDGLYPSSQGSARVAFDTKGKPTVIDGPFAEAKELIAGFWIIQARSKEEAVELAKRAPFQDGTIEVRQIWDSDDFMAEMDGKPKA